MTLIENSARIAAQEASADGICWTFSPMVDIARDPRWAVFPKVQEKTLTWALKLPRLW